MEILGVGASEFVFVIIIALILLGPKDMQKAGRTIGKWMRDIVTSDGWQAFQKTSSELRNLPARMMRDANTELDKFNRDIKTGMEVKPEYRTPPRSKPSASSPASNLPPSEGTETTPQPPPAKPAPSNESETPNHDPSA